MLKRLNVAAAVAFSLLAFTPGVARAQTTSPGYEFEWQDAPLSNVVRAFARLSGRTIVVAPDVGEPQITAHVRTTDWERALDLILATQSLVARVDASGVIRIERMALPAPRR